MQSRIVDWLSDENLSAASGKSRAEIFDFFGNDPEPIAYIPLRYLPLISKDVKDPRIYCGKGYFIDHALRNHGREGTQASIDEVDVSKYLNIQTVLDNPDAIKETFVDGKRTVVFVKKIGRYFAELTQVEEDGKIILHKSLFSQKKEPYAKLSDIRSKNSSSEGGTSSISHAEDSAPAISLQSRGDDMSETSGGKGTQEVGTEQEKSGKSVGAAVASAEAEVDTEPTDGQKEAGNYRKGHVKIDGFDVTIEQPKGSVRSGVDASGKAWSQEMHNTYGYIRGTEGVDGDHIDVFLSDHLDNWNGMVYVVDQVNKDGSFDEHKVMYGFDSEQEARDAYLSNYEEGWTGLGNITGVTRDEFKKWVDSSHRKTKPFAEYKSVKPVEADNGGGAAAHETGRTIQGLEGYSEQEILDDVRAFIEEQLEDAGIEGVTIKGMALHGSRMRGDARPDSDLDVVVEYEGDISEDAFFNLVNYDLNFRGPNGVIIDINPITRGKSGTLEQYMERSRRYDEEKRTAAAEATEPVQSTDTGEQAYTITPTKYTTKKNKELDVWLVKFSGEIDKKQATEIAKETRGWWDREQGGFLMRSKEAARDLAERVAGATSQSDAIPEQPVESKQAQASASENASKAASEEPQQSGGTGNLTIAEVKDRIKFSDKEEERLFDEVADALTHDGLPISEAPVEVMLNSQEEIEERIRERVGDYIAAHYPTQATVSALTNSPDGLREREAMAKDADFAALRDEVEAEVASFNERFSQKLAELRSVLGKPDVTADEVASCWKDAVEFEHLRSENPENRSKTEPKREEITENRSKTEKKRSSAPKSGDRRIDDFGEKIGGARKDLARGRIRDAKKMSVKDLTTLKKGADDILSQANILRLYKDGQMDESTARHFMALNNVCKLAIKNKRPVIRDIVLGKYRDAAVAWEEGKPVTFDVTDKDLQAYRQMFPHSSEEKARESLVWQITDPLNMFMWTYESMNYPAEMRKMGQYVIVDYSKMLSPHVTLSRHIWVKNGYNAHRGYPFAKMEDAVEKMKKLCPVVQEKEKKSRGEKAEHGLRVVNEGYGYYVKSRNIPGNIYLSGKFNSEKQAQAYLDENLDRLREREQRLVDALMGSNIGMAEREGVDYRDGKDVTPQDFLDEFGFRGVEFGNWVPQGERQMYLNKTYDAIKDFCAIVGISPKAFSLGGRLGLAFGARGHSKAMAHYEPAKEVINLTRMSGVGSLAHEWFHAVDNYLAKQKTGNMSDMATVTHDVVRDELSHVFKELYDVMKSMDYHHRSRRAGEYWGRTEEEFARLFENYIYNKLASREATSPVLVRKDVLLEEVEEDMKARWPYPSLEENEKMEPYFDKLFDTIREKTDDNGHVVLFQKVEGSTISKDAAEREAALRDGLVEVLLGAGIEVVTDAEEGQRVLDGAKRAADVLNEMRKRNQQQETALPEDESSFKGTAISSADGAKVIQNLENLSKESEKLSTARIRTFLGDVADAIGATQYGSSSRYATFETISGEVVTIRLADHNAHTSGFDNSGRDNGISIVISRKPNAGINNDGEAHLVEFFYSDKQLRKAEGSPYSDIVRSIQQALYSGEYKDTTGLAQRQEVNEDVMREHRVFHGSGAEFDAFDHSHMGEGEGAQAYGWGTYVTEVEDIGRRYAETAGGVRYKGHDVDELYEHSIDGMEDSERNAAWMLSRAMRTFGFSDAVERLRSLYKQDLEKSNRLKGLSIEQTMERYGCSRADAKRYIKDAAAKAEMWQQRLDALEGMREEDFTAPSRVLYSVEIPEDTGDNYLAWDGNVSSRQHPMWYEAMKILGEQDGFMSPEEFIELYPGSKPSISVSHEMKYLEAKHSPKTVSEALHSAGFTGIVYPANYRSGGNRTGSKNYVIFDEADAQIVGREKFFRTADGTAYGFVKDGRIYIDPRIATSETPVHEYTHLWCAALRRVNPAAWARLKEALLGHQDVVDHVKKLYPELSSPSSALTGTSPQAGEEYSDELMDEVFAHYSGSRGRERLQREQERELAKAKSVFDKARVIAVFDRIRRALDNFWLAARHLFAGKTEGLEKLSAEDFADMALADLLRGFNPAEEVRKLDADGRKAAQLRLVTDANAMTDTYHTGIRRIDDIKTYEEAVDEGEGIGSYPDFTEEDARAALERGRATVYSSHPIEPGSFVSMSRMEAEEYAGGGEVYSQEVPLEDVAWIYANEGQYAPVDGGTASRRTATSFQKAGERGLLGEDEVRYNERGTTVERANEFVETFNDRYGISKDFAELHAVDSKETVEKLITELGLNPDEANDLRDDFNNQELDGTASRESNRVYIFTDRSTSMGDLINTCFHEVTHQAYKQLPRDEVIKYNNALMRWYRAKPHRNEYLEKNILDENRYDKEDWATEAMAHFMGELAETFGWDRIISGKPIYKEQEIINFVARIVNIITDGKPRKEKNYPTHLSENREANELGRSGRDREEGAQQGVSPADEDVLFNDGDDDVDEVRKEVDDYTSKYGGAEKVIINTPEDLANEYGLSTDEAIEAFDEIKDRNTAAAYDYETGKIIIFVPNLLEGETEQSCFHEDFHAWLEQKYGKDVAREVCERYLAAAKDKYPILYQSVKDNYEEERHAEEFMAYRMEKSMASGLVDKGVFQYLNEEDRQLIDEFLETLHYDKESERAERKERRRKAAPKQASSGGRRDTEEGSQSGGRGGGLGRRLTERLSGLPSDDGDGDDGTIGAYNRAVNTMGKVVRVAGRDFKPRMTRYNFQEAFQDAILSVKKLQQVVCKAHGLDKLPSKEDAWTYENRLSSINMQTRKHFIEKLYEPMMKVHDKLIKDGATVDGITEYVICKHGLERNQVFAERDAQREAEEITRNGGTPDMDALRDKYRSRDYSGLTAITGLDEIADIEADAQRRVDEFEREHGALCGQLWDAVNKATKWTLRVSYDRGMMSTETYIKVRDMFQYYVPLRGWDETTAEDVYDYMMGERGAFSGTLKTAAGRTSLADDPFATIGNMGESAIVQGNRNRLKQRLWNMATKHQTDVCQVRDMWVVQDAQGEWVPDFPDIPEDADGDTVSQLLEIHDTAMANLEQQGNAKRVTNRLDVGYHIDPKHVPEHAVVVMINGNRHVVYIQGNPRTAQAINGNLSSDKGSKNAIRRLVDFIFKDTRRYYSSVITSYNINFSGANFVRDLPHAYAMTFIKYGWRKGAKYVAKSLQVIPWVLKNQAGYSGNSRMDQLFGEFVQYGGVTGYAHIHDIDSWKADNHRRIARLNALGKGTVGTIKGLKAVIQAVGWFSETLELIPRFATYCASRDMGMDIQQSIKEAKDITTNFNKKGTEMTPGVWGAVANVLRYEEMFFNPIVQGMYQWFAVAKDSKAAKARLAGILLWMPAMGVLLPYLNQLLLAALGGGDDDDNDYFLQNEFTRRQNMLLWTGKGYAKIPIAPVFRELYGIGETIATRACGRIDDRKMAVDLVDQLRAAFSLEGQSSYREWSFARAAFPDHYGPFIDIMNNENYTGKSLWYESEWTKNKPEYAKAKESTWSPLVEISRTINGWLGGDDDIKADASGKWLNPVVWQHLITNYGGGFAQVLGDAASTLNNVVQGEVTDVSQWPIAKRFYTQPTEQRANWARYGIYKQYEVEFNKAKDKYAALRKRGLDPVEMAKAVVDFAERHPRAAGIYAAWNGGINGADYVERLKDLRKDGDDAGYWAMLKEAVDKGNQAMHTGYVRAFEEARKHRPEFMSDEELDKAFTGSQNDSTRAVMAHEIAARAGVQDNFSHDPGENYGDEARSYWNAYRRLRLSEDVVEDGKASQLLDDKEKEDLLEIKKQLGQGGDDEQIMDEYRRERRRLLQEHGVQ